jgi:hypothetical protein
MEQAFDQAWAEIAGNFGDTPSEIHARLSLARAMLSVATEAGTDVATLKAGPPDDGPILSREIHLLASFHVCEVILP